MNYYPKSQVTTNLTSNGDLVIKKTNTPYFGKYYATSTGKYFKGPIPSPIEVELTLINNTPEIEIEEEDIKIDTRFGTILNYEYSTLTSLSPDSPLKLPPPPSSPQPTIIDRNNGEYQRYFAKKTNELIYIELSIETYLSFSNGDPKFATDLYEVISLLWSLGGNNEFINRKIVNLVEKNNKWYGFSKYKGFKFSSRYTQGGEFRLPNGSNYIGPYHIMSNGTLMTGVSHGGGGDIILTSISSTSPSMGSSGGGY